MLVEDFEDTSYVWTVNSAGGWARSNTAARTGTWSFKAPTTAHNASSSLTVTVPAGASSVQFWYRVSSESGYDFFRFSVGASPQLEESGDVDWTLSPVYALGAATQLTFTYAKDGSQSVGSDTVWIDDVAFVVPVPHLLQPVRSAAASMRASRW
ncbi:hypothetical protein ABT352_33340 [Streptosporangium sp. NPDC000563]|uniref:hypothetical protein n=1 Tax=Streptosporangium sp. NPDC000563 TaxID=3154366 RepID=UPI00332A4CBD